MTCFQCHKGEHFKSQCFSQRTSQKVLDKEMDSAKGEVETVFLGPVGKGVGSWMANITVCGQPLLFKIDTGADVTAISEEDYRKIKWKELQGPSNQPLPVAGEFIGSLAYQGKSEKHQIFVVKGLKNNLLGLRAIRSMGLVRVNEITSSFKDKILAKYLALFRGLGNPGEPYEIKVKRNSKPVCLLPSMYPSLFVTRYKQSWTKWKLLVLSPKLTSVLLGVLGWLWHRNLMELSAFVLISSH